MARSENHRQKLLYLLKMFYEKTDEDHGMNVYEIIDYLEKNDIEVERKTVYRDIKTLQEFGIDINKYKSKDVSYKLLGRTFELPELKLLVDSIQSSKYITEKKSVQLIKKLESLTSEYEGKELQRQVVVANRVKSMNEKIYHNTDNIYKAINEGKKITFNYYHWVVDFNTKSKALLRKKDKQYKISPLFLAIDDENYYLIGYDSKDKKIKHYRVDKMAQIEVFDEKIDSKGIERKCDPATYAKKVFGMFGGDEVEVKLMFRNDLIGVVMDRFGKNVFISKADEESFFVTTKVDLSPQFFGWLFGFGDSVKIISPQFVADEYAKKLADVNNLYNHK